jgi:hypothetical protein
MGTGQACIGGNDKMATETIGTLTNVGRCMVPPPPTLACEASAGYDKAIRELELRFLNKSFITTPIIPENRHFVRKFFVKNSWRRYAE